MSPNAPELKQFTGSMHREQVYRQMEKNEAGFINGRNALRGLLEMNGPDPSASQGTYIEAVAPKPIDLNEYRARVNEAYTNAA